MPAGTSWESAKIKQTGLRGLEILKNTEDDQLVQTVARQQVTQMLCDTGAAPEILTEKMMEMFSCQMRLLSYWYMQGREDMLL